MVSKSLILSYQHLEPFLSLISVPFGHTLTQPSTFSGLSATPIFGAGASTTGLRVQMGKTIALIGGNINLDGGIVTAPAGQIDIGSVSTGKVIFNPSLKLDYSMAQTRQNIQLTNLSLLDASGLGSGEIKLHGNQINLLGSSFVLIQSQSASLSGNIDVNAVDSLTIKGNSINATPGNIPPTSKVRTGIISQNFLGPGADINISAKDLILQSAGGITSYALLSGSGGNISINASNSIQLVGVSPIDPINNVTVIGAASSNSGKSGYISASTNNLLIQDGGALSTGAFGVGNAGDVTVNAKSIQISGNNPSSLVPSTITSVTLGTGNAGSVNVNTQQLSILNGGKVSSSTQENGSAGNVKINASDFVNVSGTVPGSTPGSIFPSYIISSGNRIDPLVGKLFGLPLLPSGDSNNVTINTGRLSITNGAQITVKNDGNGKVGNLQVKANSISLDNQGSITPAFLTKSGKMRH